MNDPLSLSGGPLDGSVDGAGWLPGTVKHFNGDDGKTYAYRRLEDNEDIGTSKAQAVFAGCVNT